MPANAEASPAVLIQPGNFLSRAEVERHLRDRPPRLVEMALELRNLVAAIAPQASERALRSGLGYHDAGRGGPVRAGICLLHFMENHLRLEFIHGAFLRDPHHLLQGGRLAKRYAVLCDYESVPWEALEDLIRQHAVLDPTRLPVNRERD